jgi:predicted secreted Zn-dependent protease
MFLIRINGVQHRDTTVYTDREFQMILDCYGGYLPGNILARHFQQKDGPGESVMRRPSIPIPIYELTQPHHTSVAEGLRLYSKKGPRSGIPIARRYWDFVWVENEAPGGMIAHIDGVEYKLLSKYTATPIPFRYAAEYVNLIHRHNVSPPGHKFSLCLKSVEDRTVGVLIASDPKARHQDDGCTLEINRCCTDDKYHNVCSALMGKAIRVGKEMGYTRFLSYTGISEPGTSMKAAGFHIDGIVKGSAKGWNMPSRPRAAPARYPSGDKYRWLLQVA